MFPAPKSKKRLRIWRWLLFGAAAIALFVIVAGLYVWWIYERTANAGKAELAAVIAELDAHDPNWRWDALEAKRPKISDLENSIPIIHKAAVPLGQSYEKMLRLENGEPVLDDDRPLNRLLDDERTQWIQKHLKEHGQSLTLAVSLSRFPRGRAPIQLNPIIMNTLLPQVGESNSICRLLELDFERTLAEKRFSDAVQRVHAMLNLSAALRDEPFLISQFVRMKSTQTAVRCTTRTLRMGVLDENSLASLAACFGSEQKENPLYVGIIGDRAAFNFLFESLEDGTVNLAGFLSSLETGSPNNASVKLRIGTQLYGCHIYQDHAQFLNEFSELARIALLPSQDQLRAWQRFYAGMVAIKQTAETDQRSILTAFLMPAVERVGQMYLEDQARLRCILIAIAAERFRLANNHWPATLTELTPKFLPVVPTDPYTGQPLKLTATADGLVVYSVGPDGADDGGEPLLFSFEQANGPADIGIRLWNVDHRRLPPAQKPDAADKN